MILLVDFMPRLCMDSEQALARFLDCDGMMGRKMVPIKLVLTNVTIPHGLRGYDGGNLRLEGIPTNYPVR